MSPDLAPFDQAFILKKLAVSGSSLLLYDHLLTLPSEVEYIWKAPWTIVKAGFLLNRYGNLVGQLVITFEQLGFFGIVSKRFCNMYCLYCTLFMFFSGETVRLVVMLRAWAVWGCTYRATIRLIASYTLYFLALVGVACYMWKHTGTSSPVDGTCVAEIPPFGWMLWLPTLFLDSVVLMIVLISLHDSFMGFHSYCVSPLVRLLARDAIMFYIASLFNNVFSMVCWSVFRQEPRVLLQLVFSFPILSIAGQRLVLNLRQLRAQPHTPSYLSRVVDHELAAMDDDAWWHGGGDAASPTRSTGLFVR